MTRAYFSPAVEREVRARLIWHDLTSAEKASVEPSWQLGFGRWPSGFQPVPDRSGHMEVGRL